MGHGDHRADTDANRSAMAAQHSAPGDRGLKHPIGCLAGDLCRYHRSPQRYIGNKDSQRDIQIPTADLHARVSQHGSQQNPSHWYMETGPQRKQASTHQAEECTDSLNDSQPISGCTDMRNEHSISSGTAREHSIGDRYMDGESPWVAHCYVTDPAGARRIPVEIPSGENNVVGTLGDVYDTDSGDNMGHHIVATAENDLAGTQGNSPPALHDVNNGLCDAGMHTGTACYVTNGPTSSGSSSVVSAELMGNRTLGSNHPRICTNGTPAKYSSYHSRSDVDMCTGSQPFRTTAEMDSRKLEIPLGHRSCYIQEWPSR